jgi:hypothetical protein
MTEQTISRPAPEPCPPWCDEEHAPGQEPDDRVHTTGYTDITVPEDSDGHVAWVGVKLWQQPGSPPAVSVAYVSDGEDGYLPLLGLAQARQFRAELDDIIAMMEAAGGQATAPARSGWRGALPAPGRRGRRPGRWPGEGNRQPWLRVPWSPGSRRRSR